MPCPWSSGYMDRATLQEDVEAHECAEMLPLDQHWDSGGVWVNIQQIREVAA